MQISAIVYFKTNNYHLIQVKTFKKGIRMKVRFEGEKYQIYTLICFVEYDTTL